LTRIETTGWSPTAYVVLSDDAARLSCVATHVAAGALDDPEAERLVEPVAGELLDPPCAGDVLVIGVDETAPGGVTEATLLVPAPAPDLAAVPELDVSTPMVSASSTTSATTDPSNANRRRQ
jgi:hypothetical protein